jgi:hypothetical protein
MNVGVTSGVLGSAAGAPLSQTAGAETERAAKDSAARERLVDGQDKSEKAAGLGATEEDQQAGERDADGRRLWELQEKGPKKAKPEHPDAAEPHRQAKDPSGMSGNALDLTG